MNSQVKKLKAEFDQLKQKGHQQRNNIQKMLQDIEIQLNQPTNSLNTLNQPEVQKNTNISTTDPTFGSKTVLPLPPLHHFTDTSAIETSAPTSAIETSAHTSASFTTPLSVQLELKALKNHATKLPFRTYLERGYNYYLTWVTMTLGTSASTSDKLRFCVARNMNTMYKGKYPMGVDLEIRYIFKNLEKTFGAENMHLYKDAIRETLRDNLSLSETHLESFIHDYFRNKQALKVELTTLEFQKRLSLVPTEMLDSHSSSVWRNYNHKFLNSTPYPVSRVDIENGENLAPPSSRHVGLQMLEMHGYLPPVADPRQAKSFAVTYI